METRTKPQEARKAAYPDPQSRSIALFERARKVMPGGNTRLAVYQTPYPIFIAHASGSRVTDVDGVERIDFINNQSVLVHGHRYPPAMEAVERQLKKGTCFSGPSEADLALAEHLVTRSPSFERVRFTNSGSEAVMMAVKAARAFTGRHKIAKAEGAYHGTYDFIEASRASTPANWGPREAPHAVPYSKATPPSVMEATVVFPYNDIEATRALLDRERDNLAAVLVEPVANRIGMIPARAEFLRFLREYCSAHDILLAFDEVYVFRLGVGGAHERYGICGDITAMGKIVGGGFPVGAIAGRADVMGVFDPSSGHPDVPHTGTFNGNPISMVAGLETLRPMDAAFIAALNARGDRLRARLNAIFAAKGIEGQATGVGSLFRIHYHATPITDYRSGYPTPDAAARVKSLQRLLLNEGFLLAVNCSGNVSSAHTDDEIDRLAQAFERNVGRAEGAKA
ncbi:MAG TPA: aspartate aminotransferase family protein [Usitatibacter sp.]|nr:aspartate aminotransferase family protein [Usitatibacter sp.]